MVLREILLKLGLDVDAQSFAKGQLAAEAVKKGLSLVEKSAKEAIGTVVENIKATIEYTDKIDKQSQALGIATEALQELQYAARSSGLSNEEFNAATTVLTRNLHAAAEGGEAQAKAFSRLGISVKDADGKIRNADEVLGDLAIKFGAMEDGAQKSALAMEVLGKSGARMLPMLKAGEGGLGDMRKEARELGLVLDDVTIKIGTEVGDNIARVKAVTVGLWRAGIAPLLPAINTLVKRILEWQKANAGIIKEKIEKYIGIVVRGIELLADTFEFLVDNGDAVIMVLKGIGVALIALNATAIATAAATAAAWVSAAAPFLAIGAAVGLILAILDDVRVFKKQMADPNFKGQSILGLWSEAIKEWLKPAQNEPWWLTAAKDLVRLLAEALDIAKELGIVDAKNQKQTEQQRANMPWYRRAYDAVSDKVGGLKGKARIGAYGAGIGLALSGPAVPLAAVGYGGYRLGKFGYRKIFGGDEATGQRAETAAPAYTPEAPMYSPMLAPATNQNTSVNYSPSIGQITVNAQPGQSPQDIAAAVRDEVSNFWDSRMEEAGSGVLK